jgi:3-methyladenine DNA glycosylase AlkD
MSDILNQIKTLSKGKTNQAENLQYHGNHHTMYHLTNGQRRDIAKSWVKNNTASSLPVFIQQVTHLFEANSYDEKLIASFILQYHKKLRTQIDATIIETWLEQLEGWAEVDALSQSIFTAEELLADWPTWHKLLQDLSTSSNINKRRASLVLLTLPVKQTESKTITNQAFENIDKLKHEKNILITKAISWLLRNLLTHNKDQVQDYILQNESTLPKIALRDVKNKLNTGKKD